MIADAAHALFSFDGDGIPLGRGAAAAIFCPRKSLGVPDGGACSLTEATRPRRAGAHRASAFSDPRPRSPSAAPQSTRGTRARRCGRRAAPVSKADVATERASSPTWSSASGISPSTTCKRRRRGHHGSRRWLRRASTAVTIRSAAGRTISVWLPTWATGVPARSASCPRACARCICRCWPTTATRRCGTYWLEGSRAIEVWPVPHPLLDRTQFAELEPLRRGLLALPVHQQLDEAAIDKVRDAALAALSRDGWADPAHDDDRGLLVLVAGRVVGEDGGQPPVVDAR